MPDIKSLSAELSRFYSSYDPDTERMMTIARDIYDKRGDKDSAVVKTEIIEAVCKKAKLHLFKRLPFFFEFSCGRNRFNWGGNAAGVGRFLADVHTDEWLNGYAREMNHYYENGYLFGWNNPVGLDHHCICYDEILEKGLFGIIADIQKRQREEKSEEKRRYYDCLVTSLACLGLLAMRFCDRAMSLYNRSKRPETRAHYLKIAKAAKNVPTKPAQSFYEALCCILFCREAIGSLDGIGISTFGHIDRLLGKYLEADIASGEITLSEARELIRALLIYTEIRFDKKNGIHETSTTMVLGGCDGDGNVVFNDVTRLVLETVCEERSVGTKILCRITREHPEEYISLISSVQASNIPTLVVQNDEVHIAARTRHGQDIRDARLYVGGGCHETVLAGTEVNTRADTYTNPVRVLLDTLARGGYEDFDSFYKAYLSDYAEFYRDVCRIKNKYEAMWRTLSPLPLYSATVKGCVESGKDVTEGGAKYSNTSLSNVGAATLIDSLYSIKRLVFDEKIITLSQFSQILSENFEKNDELQRYIVNKIPKYGTANEELDDFSASVLSDFAKNLPKLKNARGGDYMPAFYPHDRFIRLGEITGATPDGRPSGTPLSRGCSPSEFVSSASPLDVFHSIKGIDFTDFTESFCCEITIPKTEDESLGRNIVAALIKAFIDVGGSTLQINMLDREQLLDAKKNPELHRDILVRICGYSEHFVNLSETHQDEIISRSIRS